MQRPWRELQVVCQRTFGVCGAVVQWRWGLVGDLVLWGRWWRMMRNLVIWRRWWRWIGVELMMHLLKQRLLPLLLLAKDVDGVLRLYDPCSPPV
jgi:hypothetical protein